jgi:UDP-N-acetylglucosamine acyltransferase
MTINQTARIHKSAIIESGAKIGKNVAIGPFSIIGPEVEINNNTTIGSSAIIQGKTKIGKNNRIFDQVIIGTHPQNTHYFNQGTKITIGNNNIIKEHTTIHLGTPESDAGTIIGNDCFFMVNSHIAHDCIVGNNVIIANNTPLGGVTKVGDGVFIGGNAAAHQYTTIGKYAMIAGLAAVIKDVPPFTTTALNPNAIFGINAVGLKRRNFKRTQMHKIRNILRFIYESKLEKSEIAQAIKKNYENDEITNEFINFLNTSTRQLAPYRKRGDK